MLVNAAERVLAALLRRTEGQDIVFIVGLPVAAGSALLNAAAVCYRGEILGVIPKTCLPNYKEFYEQRWFTSSLEWGGGEVDLCGRRVPAGTEFYLYIEQVTDVEKAAIADTVLNNLEQVKLAREQKNSSADASVERASQIHDALGRVFPKSLQKELKGIR